TNMNKSYEMARFCDVNVAIFLRICKTGQLITFKSADAESWPPLKEQIQCTYPLPVSLLPQDIEAKYEK
ncbi:hypothetical protein B0O99DRAFT_479438, partial [Bisporella sp. PMI_857]